MTEKNGQMTLKTKLLFGNFLKEPKNFVKVVFVRNFLVFILQRKVFELQEFKTVQPEFVPV